MSTPVLHVEHVTMQFGGVVAVNDLSMDVYDREIVALIGPNGAGKTTAFNCITGVYEPTNGRVDFLGEPIVCNHPHGKMKKIYAGEGAERYLDQRVVSYTPDVITKRGIARTFQNIRLFKNGFRMAIVSVIIMLVVLFFRKGIMGDRELTDLLRRKPRKEGK